MNFMQVHAHLQKTVLENYHPLKMRVVNPLDVQTKRTLRDIEVLVAEDINGKHSIKFNLQQTWMLQSPSTYRDAYGFHRALMGHNYISPASELCVTKYKSLAMVEYNADIGCHAEKCVAKYKPFMNAYDVVKFLLSDFARRGQYDEIFANAHAYRELKVNVGKQKATLDEREQRSEQDSVSEFEPDTHEPTMRTSVVNSECTGPPELVNIIKPSNFLSAQNDPWRPSSVHSGHGMTQSKFIQTCVSKIENLKNCFLERASIESDECYERKKKRKVQLANTAMEAITDILLQANVLLYDETAENDH
jgi:hypothetical protein